MEEKKIERHNLESAKAIVDTLFNAKLFRDGVTRDNMNATEEYLAYMLQSNEEMVEKSVRLIQRIEESKKKNNS